MKKILIASILFIAISFQCVATVEGPDMFDFYGVLPYDGKTLDKTTIALCSEKFMDVSSSNFFDDYLLTVGMPLGLADVRFEGWFIKGSDPMIKISTVVPFWIASLQAGYFVDTGSATYKELNLELIFSNLLFNWGIGIAQDMGSSPDTNMVLKISKQIDTGVAKIEGKATYTQIASATDNELDLMVKARFSALPIYAAVSNYSAGTASGNVVVIGTMFNM